LAIEYAKDGIRFNAVAPGEVDTPMHRNESNGSSLQSAIKRATVKDIVDAVLLPGKSRSCERRDTPCGWRRSGSSLVAGRQCILYSCQICQLKMQKNDREKNNWQ